MMSVRKIPYGLFFIVILAISLFSSARIVNASPAAAKNIRVVVFGDSIAAGYGLDPSEAFPTVLEELARADGTDITVVNAGLSGETTAGGARRITWILNQPIDIFVLELGGNDALRGLDLAQTESNLRTIITAVKAKHPQAKIILAGMLAPPNLGQDFTDRFRNIYPKLATETGATLIPFILEGVGGEAAYNQPDGIHPNRDGHRMIAQTVWRYVRVAAREAGVLAP